MIQTCVDFALVGSLLVEIKTLFWIVQLPKEVVVNLLVLSQKGTQLGGI